MTANSFRVHSGSGLSGSPPSEPFSLLKRATRFSISSRLKVRIFRQSLIVARLLAGYYRSQMTLRTRLVLLVAATLAPMVVCAVVAARQIVVDERAVVERNL